MPENSPEERRPAEIDEMREKQVTIASRPAYIILLANSPCHGLVGQCRSSSEFSDPFVTTTDRSNGVALLVAPSSLLILSIISTLLTLKCALVVVGLVNIIMLTKSVVLCCHHACYSCDTCRLYFIF